MPPPALPLELIGHILCHLRATPSPSVYPSTQQSRDQPNLTTTNHNNSRATSAQALQALCNSCLVSRSVLPYARRELYRTLILGSTRQVRLLARTLDNVDEDDKQPPAAAEESAMEKQGTEGKGNGKRRPYWNDVEERSPYNSGSLIPSELLLALSPSASPQLPPLAQSSPTCSSFTPPLPPSSEDLEADTDRIPSHSGATLGHLIRSLCLTHADGYLASGDVISDTHAWPCSLRVLFTRADRLEVVSIVSRPDGAVLEQLVHPQTSATLRSLTLQCLSFAPPRFAHDPTPHLFANLTHLHLIQALPTSQLLSILVGNTASDGSSAAALTHLRLSRLHLDSLNGLESSFTQLESLASSTNTLTAPSTPQALLCALTSLVARFRPRTSGSPARTELHKALWVILRTRNVCFPRLQVILLELAEQQPLDAPWGSSAAQWQFAHHLYATNTSGTAGAGVSRAPGEHTTLSGQLATLDFPADMPLGLPPSLTSGGSATAGSGWTDEATAEQDEERRRTASRDAYWLAVRDGKEALVSFAKRGSLSSSGDEERSGSSITPVTANHGIEVRVVAPRPGGWSYHESQADFEASLSSNDGGFAAGAAQVESAFADPDVFALAEQENGWMLGYAPVSHPHGSGAGSSRKDGAQGEAQKSMYWTGVLPRVRAQMGIIGGP